MKVSDTVKLLFIICLLVCSCKRQHGNIHKASVHTSRFQAGQIWTFHTPTNELPGAELTVVRVDFDPEEGPIIYISVTGVRHTFWEAPNKFYPFSEAALNRSVVTLVGTNATLTRQDLQYFRQFYETGQRGIQTRELNKCFKITVAEVLEAERKKNN